MEILALFGWLFLVVGGVGVLFLGCCIMVHAFYVCYRWIERREVSSGRRHREVMSQLRRWGFQGTGRRFH